MTKRVWIAQCLCPSRHAILATAGEATNENEAKANVRAPLIEQVESLLRAKAINPWCGICGARQETWTYELGRTPFTTLEEATPKLSESEREQEVARTIFGDLHHRQKPN